MIRLIQWLIVDEYLADRMFGLQLNLLLISSTFHLSNVCERAWPVANLFHISWPKVPI